jgi:glycosyltransferase involved in cell wall biosynthesis
VPESDPVQAASSLPSILIIVGSLDRGGTERHLLQVLPALRRRGFPIQVYVLTHRGELAVSFEREGVPVVQPPLAEAAQRLPPLVRRHLLTPVSIAFLFLFLLRRRPTIAHCFLPHAYLAGGLCALAARVPIRIMSRRGLNGYQRQHPALARLEFWLHRHTHWMLGNSEAVVAQLTTESGVDARHVSLIYNGVDTRPFAHVPDRRTVREELGIPGQALLLLVVANLIPYKGHVDLLEALAVVKDQLPSGWKLLCVGRDDGIGQELAIHAEGLGIAEHVVWTGPRDDVPALQRAADIGILCSHEEGFSNAVLEGMAARLPMVVTDVGGNGEAVIDGETGVVVPARATAQMGRVIARLARDERTRDALGRAARRRIAQLFTLDRCVEQYEQLYIRLINDRAQGGRASKASVEPVRR